MTDSEPKNDMPAEEKPLPLVMQKLEKFALGLYARIDKYAKPKRKFYLMGFTPYQEGKISYVGFNDRVVASTIDTLISCLLLYKIMAMIAVVLFGKERAMQLYGMPTGSPQENAAVFLQQEGYLQDWMFNNLLFTVIMAMPIIACWIYASTTPGKWLFQMRIVDATTGMPMTRRQSVVRYLGYLVASLPLFLGFLWVIKDKRKQGWHDKIANTVVVRVKGWRLAKVGESVFPAATVSESS